MIPENVLYNRILTSLETKGVQKKNSRMIYIMIHNRFGHAVENTGLMLDNALKMKENILLEGRMY